MTSKFRTRAVTHRLEVSDILLVNAYEVKFSAICLSKMIRPLIFEFIINYLPYTKGLEG